jgi:hypothetical protein
MSFALQRPDRVQREQHDRAIGTAMKAEIALTIAVDPGVGDEPLEHALLRYAAARRVDRLEPSSHGLRIIDCLRFLWLLRSPANAGLTVRVGRWRDALRYRSVATEQSAASAWGVLF